MLIAAAAIIAGFAILIWSADLFIIGAAAIARNMGMSPIVIGMTIVSIGTSAPGQVNSPSAMPSAPTLPISAWFWASHLW